ncbi:acetolactate decarboxylase [Succinimonas amylolytica]|uniref:acetolactate decarboxylase n=1 Tax=Succinimonas amylolytica TaxID=83769 RepID=UPI00037C844D|nr:acetolactate decarboxylase [Succinimonas amylolytica]
MKFSRKGYFFVTLLVGLMTAGLTEAYAEQADRESIAQVALLQSLAQGYFGGTITAAELMSRGDTGIGTFEGLNGEMIALDGKIYQALGDGTVIVAPDNTIIPYATVTFFDNDFAVKLTDIRNKADFEKAVNAAVQEHGVNSFYMVKLNAEFDSILFRSEYGSKEPYPTLVEALKGKQTEFSEKNIKGTLVGLFCPNYMSELNTPGWHFHFISDDKKKGGHILELSLKDATVYFDKTDKFTMLLHDDPNFHKINLKKDMSEDIRSAEHDTKGKMQK